MSLIDTAIVEADPYFSLFDPRTWFRWNRRTFRVTFTIPASQNYEVSQCYGIPQLNPTRRDFECLLLIYFEESKKPTQKITSFYVEFSCPLQLSQVTFNLAVPVKQALYVSL